MIASAAQHPASWTDGLASVALLSVAVLALGALDTVSFAGGIVLGAIGVGLSVAARRFPDSRIRAGAPVPVLVVLGTGALAAPVSPLAEIVAVLASAAFLLWLVDDPTRPAGRTRRGATTVLVPLLAVGIAWTSAQLLPAGAASPGLVGGLLAVVLGSVAYLVARPTVFDREEPATS